MASPGLSHFRGWPVQDSVFFWILAHREIWGWQEGSDTLYMCTPLLRDVQPELWMVAGDKVQEHDAPPADLVAQVEEVALREVQARVHVLVQLPVPLPQLHVEVRASLARELAVEDQDVTLLILRLGVVSTRKTIVMNVVGRQSWMS